MATSNGNPQAPESSVPTPPKQSKYHPATLGIHADDPINEVTDVAPPLHVSSTFRYARNPSQLKPADYVDIPDRTPLEPVLGDTHVYSRMTAPNSSRLELVLTSLLDAPCLTYGSGLAAFNALLVYLHPKTVAIGAGYHGCHGVLKVYQKLTNCRIVDLFDEASWSSTAGSSDSWSLGPGDVVHLETPVNPTGHAYNIEHFAQLAHARGAVLTLDATFAPPPLLDPWAWGADFVMHSGTKYFGGHSDMLCGVIAVNTQRPKWEDDYWGLQAERLFLGAAMGSLEAWLGVRSLRTLELRVRRQSSNAEHLVKWLDSCLHSHNSSSPGKDPDTDEDTIRAIRSTVARIDHASLQKSDMSWLRAQMPNGFGPVFALWMKNESLARRLPSHLQLFHHATSLGGVESLIEWRRMSDSTIDATLERISIGVEDWRDLRDDLASAFKELEKEG